VSYDNLVKKHKVNNIIHLAGILSALGEQKPDLSIDVNIFGAVNALKVARENDCKIFIPSSISVFGGDNFLKLDTPVDSVL
jgi:nucleoside-diphosphate-sugar epimerase